LFAVAVGHVEFAAAAAVTALTLEDGTQVAISVRPVFGRKSSWGEAACLLLEQGVLSNKKGILEVKVPLRRVVLEFLELEVVEVFVWHATV
jgi:hypothetical protein